MPNAAKRARLWLRRERRDIRGRVTHPAVYVIRDGKYQESTGCGRDDRSLTPAAGLVRCVPQLCNQPRGGGGSTYLPRLRHVIDEGRLLGKAGFVALSDILMFPVYWHTRGCQRRRTPLTKVKTAAKPL